jgi:putative ABC transport system ATP-binding protein
VSAVLEADRLYRFYHAGDDETLALRGVSLAVQPGEIVAVTGPSGSGKSTLLALLAGLDDPDGGTVWIGGERLSRRAEEVRARIRARRVGVLYQLVNLVGHLDLAGNVRLAQRLRDDDGDPTPVPEILDAVGLRARANALPRELSGGERARAGLAVALANDPDILLCDEPTGELDGAAAERVLVLLRQRAAAGAAVVVVTHSERVAGDADRVLALRDGEAQE